MSVAGNVAPGPDAADNAPGQRHSDSGVMDGASSSKVTVEYHDPSGVFPLIQEQLTARFPLRNLHWKSPNRPLRSIDSLHVELVPSQKSVHIAGVTSHGQTLSDGSQGSGSGDHTAETTSNIRAATKERRHQIPGLRQTPYLKVYLLRCDDSETYKATARKQLREWVKAHTPPAQSSSTSSKQENHDAFEWMIIHVVVPDTPAAGQPRGSTPATAAAGEKEKSSATSLWTRGTTTIFEKIRADFNVSSKSALDRVAQVRIRRDAVPAHMLPPAVPTLAPAVPETPQEEEHAWNDVVTKFKSLILLSFDLRVSQYEEDIREKDAQRSLPGWNFCTFFMLKEGLARGFESAGLVEDALLGYDELSVGLDTVIRSQAEDGEGGQGGEILPFTEELFKQASQLYAEANEQGPGDESRTQQFDTKPISWRRKNYRDLILSNKISIFDFRCYIFARQMALLLRLGNAHSARSDLSSKSQVRPSSLTRSTSEDIVGLASKSGAQKEDPEDLLSLAELCSRALNFITFAGRLLREDLRNGAKAHAFDLPQAFVDNLVQSWTYSALQQILEETATPSLPVSTSHDDMSTKSSGKMQPFGDMSREQKLNFVEPKTMAHPKRSSSLQNRRSSSADPPYAQTPASGQVVFENGQYRDAPAPSHDIALQQKTGAQELAGTRAQLYLVQRRILESIGKSLGWAVGWAAVLSSSGEAEFSEVSLDGEAGSEEKGESEEKTPSARRSTHGLTAPALLDAVSSNDRFRQCYEILSDLIVKHYMAAGQNKAAESILGDLAALRFDMGDFAAAAMYFGRMASTYGETRWNQVEAAMLRMYAQCLKKLNRKDEYVRTLLDLLTKSAANKKRLNIADGAVRKDPAAISRNWLDDDKVDTTGYLTELVEYSEQLPYDRAAPMSGFFNDIAVDPYIRHYEDKDGFQLRLQFRHVLEDEVQVDRAKVRLISSTSVQAKEIWLESAAPIDLKRGMCRVWLDSNVHTNGPYIVDKILFSARRIIFSHEPFTKSEATTPLGIINSVSAMSLKAAKKARILCFPRMEAFHAELTSSRTIHMDQRRSVELRCSTGWNEIQHAEIRLRSSSAGLRLHTANTTVASGSVAIKDKKKPGIITMGSIFSETTVTLQIPYDLETMLPELSIKAEIEYTTEKGQFVYLSSFSVPIDLPLDVNVHDHFKNNSLFSKFNIKSANHVPLEILEVKLEGSAEYDVVAPRHASTPTMVFPKQPMAVTCKIIAKEAKRSKKKASKPGSLALSVMYRSLQEDVLDRLVGVFTAAIMDSSIQRLGRLLIGTFRDQLQRSLAPQLEKIALLERIDLGPFEDMQWSETIDALPIRERQEVYEWLQNWHTTHTTIHVPRSVPSSQDSATSATPSQTPNHRKIIISVSIPQTHILTTTSLTPLNAPTPSTTISSPFTTLTAGQPVHLRLRIKHTRRWGPREKLPTIAKIATPDAPIDFIYTIEANPEIWLVAGPRRARFSAKEGEVVERDVVLVPIREGRLMVPDVGVRVLREDAGDGKKTEGEGKKNEEEELACETDCLSAGEVVHVVPDVRSVTVGVGEMGERRSVVWLEGVVGR
ncbi:hypothetical protein M011DRAFT_471787 [Sporormia fimetaria CBS 119925]|uniref:TMEM1 family protein-like protein n=1 Tax=Sporormia fimetaria CBS 119925 TaxID=1340428 RepID=A0A6A6UX89_9PLEO|nr:hypothetical protein M011DRAFT_471787 [Sporormia fimetaria CBS 119925]